MTTILIVDDEIVIKLILKTMLRKQNYTVVTADHGAAALSILAETSVDLVITDIMMPEMDGLTLLQQLRGEENGGDLPIIVLTAVGAKRWKTQAKLLGADTILTKPIGSEELLRAIENSLGLSEPSNGQQGKRHRLGWT